MAKLNYNEIKENKVIIYNDEPCVVVEAHVARTQQRKPQNQAKLKSLISGKTFAATFHTSDTADEADLDKKEVKFIFENKGEYWFSEPENPSKRFQVGMDVIGDKAKFLKPNSIVDVLIFVEDEEEQIIGISLPIKLEFTVKDAPPNVKGSTASGGDKKVTIETGAMITTPMFIEVGDKIIVNTETGEYVERAR